MKGIKNLVTQLHQGRTRWVHSPGLEAKPLCQRNKNGGSETERPSVYSRATKHIRTCSLVKAVKENMFLRVF